MLQRDVISTAGLLSPQLLSPQNEVTQSSRSFPDLYGHSHTERRFAYNEQPYGVIGNLLSVQVPAPDVEWRYIVTSGVETTPLENSDDIIQKIDEASVSLDFRDAEEPPPSAYAVRSAKKLIRNVSSLRAGFHLAASVRPFNGSIRIIWASSSRNVRLICNASGLDPSYIYYERLVGKRAVQHETEPAEARVLSRRLSWLKHSSL